MECRIRPAKGNDQGVSLRHCKHYAFPKPEQFRDFPALEQEWKCVDIQCEETEVVILDRGGSYFLSAKGEDLSQQRKQDGYLWI